MFLSPQPQIDNHITSTMQRKGYWHLHEDYIWGGFIDLYGSFPLIHIAGIA